MATTTNYSWTTPDDTALVKDGAAAIRSLGTAIDTTVFTNAGAAVAKATVDAKGDLIAGTADNTIARLAVGANDTVLTADSTTATGLKWAAAASGANFTLLNSGGTSLSGGTTTVSGISGKNSIFAIIDTGGASFTQGNFGFRVNGITTNTYTNNYVSISAPSSYSSAYYTGLNQLNTYIKAGQQSTNAGSKAMATILIEGAGTSGFKVYTVIGGATPNGGNEQGMIWGQGVVDTTTITSISAFTDSSFNSGTLFVYGA